MEYVAFMFVLTVMAYFMYKQQQTIDRLTEKVMAKDYGEYKRNNMVTTGGDLPKRERKPMSYYDDPSIEVEDEH